MLLNEIRRWVERLTSVDQRQASVPDKSSEFNVDFDPTWHGDHWQNLLACPMDARHYVMEDWSVTPFDPATAQRAPRAH